MNLAYDIRYIKDAKKRKSSWSHLNKTCKVDVIALISWFLWYWIIVCITIEWCAIEVYHNVSYEMQYIIWIKIESYSLIWYCFTIWYDAILYDINSNHNIYFDTVIIIWYNIEYSIKKIEIILMIFHMVWRKLVVSNKSFCM